MATKQELQDAKIVTGDIVGEIKDFVENKGYISEIKVDGVLQNINNNSVNIDTGNNIYMYDYPPADQSLRRARGININKKNSDNKIDKINFHFVYSPFDEEKYNNDVSLGREKDRFYYERVESILINNEFNEEPYYGNSSIKVIDCEKIHPMLTNKQKYSDGEYLVKSKEIDERISTAVSGVDLSSKANLSIYSLSNNGGTEVQSSISQGNNSVGFNYQKNMNNELPKYININFNGEYNDDYFTLATTAYVDNAVNNIQGGAGSITQATDTTLGTIKLNPSESINVNADGQLTVGGRIGQFEGTTGLFAPNDREPRQVGDYSLLITDAKGMDISNRAFALVSGYGLACKSAAAGTTQYRITNNYANRIIAKMCEGGYIALNEESSKASKIIPVVSVTINGSPFTPDSSANSSNDIIITTEETLNPDSAITNIRLFGKMQAYATVHTGNGVASWGGGRNLILGGAVTKAGSANDNCLVGMSIYSSGNGNACFGRQHIATKNRGLLAGTGHDTTNAKTEAVSALGEYSYIDSNTLFAVGNGTSHTARSNAFEVTNNGIILKSPNGKRFRISVTDTGELITAEL